MSQKKKKQASKNYHSTERNHRTDKEDRHRRQTSKLSAWISRHPWLVWQFPLIGFVSLIWFLIRVIPKPSRAAYPCQRLAAPLASGFVVWMGGVIGSALIYRRARQLKQESRYVTARIIAIAAVFVICSSICIIGTNPAAAEFSPSESANSPIGIAKGIHPGRVVWIRDGDATSWDGATGSWWDDSNTDQSKVDAMVSQAIQSLTGQQTDRHAWDALFRHFNKTKRAGDTGYQKGEKIAIKINCNQDRSAEWGKGRRPLNGLPSPHVIYSLVSQLITAAGVPGEDITLYEVAQRRNIGEPVYNKIRANSDPDFQAVKFVVNTDYELGGRLSPNPDMVHPIHFAQKNLPTAYLPKCVTGAKYLINLALLRPHTLCGVTLTAKNHYGSIYFQDHGWTPRVLHESSSAKNPLGTYNNLVDLIGHKHLGGKTLLYMLDALYTAEHNEGNVFRFQSFGDDWASSLLISQDPVAIDSVGLDILRSEPRATRVSGNPDNYMHEAALANKPPSGTAYDPEGDGSVLESLGVHEHWNNPTDRKYSRNLGTGNGIELIMIKKD
jgi:hypothetical protein